MKMKDKSSRPALDKRPASRNTRDSWELNRPREDLGL